MIFKVAERFPFIARFLKYSLRQKLKSYGIKQRLLLKGIIQSLFKKRCVISRSVKGNPKLCSSWSYVQTTCKINKLCTFRLLYWDQDIYRLLLKSGSKTCVLQIVIFYEASVVSNWYCCSFTRVSQRTFDTHITAVKSNTSITSCERPTYMFTSCRSRLLYIMKKGFLKEHFSWKSHAEYN